MSKSQFVIPTVEDVCSHMEAKFREKFPIRDEAAMRAIARSWAEDFIDHYTRAEWTWGRYRRPMKEWKIAAGQWFRRNVEDGKHLRQHGPRISTAPIAKLNV